MRRMTAGLFLVFSITMTAQQLPFEGTWKVRQSTKVTGKPMVFSLQGGKYDCPSCVPPIQGLTADGKDQPVKGDPTADSLSVSSVNDKTVKLVAKKDGKVISDETLTLANDGKKLEAQGVITLANGATSKGSSSFTRVANGPKGSLPVSGSWNQSVLNMGEESSWAVYKMNPDGSLTYDDKASGGYTAKFDAADHPVKGGQGINSVVIKKVDDHTLEEDYKDEKGNVVLVSTTKVSKDGKHATVTNEAKETGRTYHFEADKQ
jgi:hypothetical protein